MFIPPPLSVQTLYDGDSVYKRRLRAIKAFRCLSKPFDDSQAFRDSEVNPMSSLAHTWYINTHPHMHKAEAGERVRVSYLYSLY